MHNNFWLAHSLVWLVRNGWSLMPGITTPAMKPSFAAPFGTLGRRFCSLHVQHSHVGEQMV